FALREAVKPFVTDTVFKAKKKAFVTQHSRVSDPKSKMGILLQDTLRGKDFKSNPFFDQAAVLKLLDELKDMTDEQRHAKNGVLLTVLGSCILQKAYSL